MVKYTDGGKPKYTEKLVLEPLCSPQTSTWAGLGLHGQRE